MRSIALPCDVVEVIVEYLEVLYLIRQKSFSLATLDQLSDRIFNFKKKCVVVFPKEEYSYAWPNYDSRMPMQSLLLNSSRRLARSPQVFGTLQRLCWGPV